MKYTNNAGGILAGNLYIDQSHPDYDRYVAGEFGEIEPFVDTVDYLEQAKSNKSAEVRSWFRSVENDTVTDSSSVTWNGGFDSALAIDGAVRIAETAGLSGVRLYDASNNYHDYSLEQGRAVAVTVAASWQALFSQKQAMMRAIEDAQSIEEVDQVL